MHGTDAPGQYHLWYYDSAVWTTTTYRGVGCQKSVSDMWNYQEIISDLKPTLVIEFGTFNGGSALFFADALERVVVPSRVLTVDIDHSRVPRQVKEDPRIDFLTMSSSEPKVAARIRLLREQYPGPVFAILDSDHRMEHVFDEMLLLRDLLVPGDYLIVEDSNINGHPVLPGWGPGPMEAILEYEERYPGDYVHDHDREKRFGFTFAPNGFLIRR